LTDRKEIINALTVDVEDFFHVAALSETIKPSDWGSFRCRVEKNTERLLTLFDEHKTKATFFVLGWVAERYPDLIKKIYNAGHEIASHGYSHQLIYTQPPEIFRQETIRSKNLLESIIQAPVLGYRAASYSITPRSKWAMDILVESGFEYDSSIFPVKHDRYGMSAAPSYPYLHRTETGNEIIEFPLSTFKIGSYKLPIAGGGYFRLFPYWFSKLGLRSNNKKNQPFIFYLHPWEIDPDQPRIEVSALSKFRHYNNLGKCESRLQYLLNDFRFDSVNSVLKSYQVTRSFLPE